MNKPIVLDLTSLTTFQFSASPPEIKSKPIAKVITKKAAKRVAKSKLVAKFIYDDNNQIVLNPKWSRKP